MENNSSVYTLDDIKKFIEDYKAGQEEPKDWMISIPVIGRKRYQKACLESSKIRFFEQAYNKAKSGSVEEQIEFISQMSPVLDDFYLGKENQSVRKK